MEIGGLTTTSAMSQWSDSDYSFPLTEMPLMEMGGLTDTDAMSQRFWLNSSVASGRIAKREYQVRHVKTTPSYVTVQSAAVAGRIAHSERPQTPDPRDASMSKRQ
eukprot:9033660-Karenia_brevis.AAC.1